MPEDTEAPAVNKADLIKIEWLEDVKLGKKTHYEGTTDFVTQEEYDTYVMCMGWAKNAESGETRDGGRNTEPQVISIDNAKQTLGTE